MNTKPPTDYNPHIHGHSPRSRVERLAWLHRDSESINIRMAAATILVMTGCLASHHLAVVQCGSCMARHSRRRMMAHQARKLRRYVYGDHPRPPSRGATVWIRSQVDEVSAICEAQAEGRLLPRGRPDFHG